MAPDDDLKKRVARKLTKRRREGHQVTMEIPDRFKDGDDAEDDCTAPQGANPYLNQSVFGMIAAAGSQVDFNARFDGQSSDEEEDSAEAPSRSTSLQVKKTRRGRPVATAPAPALASTSEPKRHRRKFSEHKLIRSLTRLPSRSKSKTPPTTDSPPPESHHESPPEILVSRMPTHTPVMSRMLEAKAEASLRPSFDLLREGSGLTDDSDPGNKHSSSLAKRLMEIFEFENAEDVIEGLNLQRYTVREMLTQLEYPCWLLKSVLLQGYMYITAKHICFYAYLPKKSVRLMNDTNRL